MKTNSTDLAALFFASAGQAIDDDAEQARVGVALTHALAEARRKYPGVRVSDDQYARYLGERLKGSDANAATIASRATSDIYLACGCVARDGIALELLDRQVLASLPAAMGRLKINASAIEEAIQRARAKLLVGQEGVGKLIDFSGTGDLRGWIKVIAIRDALRTVRKRQREVSLSDELQAALPADQLDPDIAYQRKLYRSEFKASFEAAVDELNPRDRTLLRQSIVYNCTVDQVATVYQVHRATAARWIAKAREQLAAHTRSHLRQRLSISESQFHSIVRLIESQMDLSVERLLASADSDEKIEDDQ